MEVIKSCESDRPNRRSRKDLYGGGGGGGLRLRTDRVYGPHRCEVGRK